MKSVDLIYGDGRMVVEVPENATIFNYAKEFKDPEPLIDNPIEATRLAIENPLGMEPLSKMAKPGKKVVICFPDRVKGGGHKYSHRRNAIPVLMQILEKCGVKRHDIKLICAMGLHRKNTLKEMMEVYLGKEIVKEYGDLIVNHDSEDPEGMIYLGKDELGDFVSVNKYVYNADIAILIGHVLGNPYGGFSGGYKMAVTGITEWKSISSHHCPEVMHREDFLPVNTEKSMMRKKFDSIGKAIEKSMGKKFFMIDAVLNQKSEVIAVYAGYGEEVQKASWPLAKKKMEVYFDIDEPYDVLVFGLPRTFHYGPGMGTNPILMLQAIGSMVTRTYGVFREGGVVIAPSICDGWFNDEWFPSYKSLYNKLQALNDFSDVFDFAEEFVHIHEFIDKYRFSYAYHPFHAFSMVSMGIVALKHTSKIYITGARAPQYARGMNLTPVNTFNDALKDAEKIVGKNPRILVLHEALAGIAPHIKFKQ